MCIEFEPVRSSAHEVSLSPGEREQLESDIITSEVARAVCYAREIQMDHCWECDCVQPDPERAYYGLTVR